MRATFVISAGNDGTQHYSKSSFSFPKAFVQFCVNSKTAVFQKMFANVEWFIYCSCHGEPNTVLCYNGSENLTS